MKLRVHPDKLFIKTVSSGLDFLGWVHFSDHRTLRTVTKRRMMRRIEVNQSDGTIASYLGLMKHGNTNRVRKDFIRTLEEFDKLP